MSGRGWIVSTMLDLEATDGEVELFEGGHPRRDPRG